MFRKSRRPVGRHTDAYLARRANGAPVAAPDAEVPTDTAAERDVDAMLDRGPEASSEEASETPATDLDDVAGDDHHDMLCTRCATTLEGDELAAARARREAGAA